MRLRCAVGLAGEMDYETIGPPDLADVQIATELAEMFELRHVVRFLDMRVAEPFGDRFRRFVHLTAGMVNGWDLQGSVLTDDLRLTGICGELLRSCQKLPESARAQGGLWNALGPALGRLGLVRPEVAERLRMELRNHLEREPSPEADPLDRAQARLRLFPDEVHPPRGPGGAQRWTDPSALLAARPPSCSVTR